ncbi:hypothetical protein Mp_5g01190 [Marchantia polymorpha subsp. ruderalis]|uniref:Uncharacterized protein n=2 Tax=Marchantia polymorpha TaxID=3197 RepID=A0AAF6BDN8_MARPO|nr:hypothetical protein MARPO_0197s0013 [Marchantia polymorpha]BBN10122.1 hypothetical protein Mp_5g01190 [Marchantia polymorpha subsp. ruderalis]PTQ27465.1 hypothetical protein MARPO_0197s0013 [Marchantia polymorpha]PTQ27466.1 hypothetical protein MARPO_0197s0013 [Marchantia polymorpha]PTQ27467.1 hypothetical protein MARPO_0197s0013 [Marchantia polymorpha]|eukprot:PTQ27464.1 hypothetical protein MARPO_0197s0013 [Marchantia polymorpha]
MAVIFFSPLLPPSAPSSAEPERGETGRRREGVPEAFGSTTSCPPGRPPEACASASSQPLDPGATNESNLGGPNRSRSLAPSDPGAKLMPNSAPVPSPGENRPAAPPTTIAAAGDDGQLGSIPPALQIPSSSYPPPSPSSTTPLPSAAAAVIDVRPETPSIRNLRSRSDPVPVPVPAPAPGNSATGGQDKLGTGLPRTRGAAGLPRASRSKGSLQRAVAGCWCCCESPRLLRCSRFTHSLPTARSTNLHRFPLFHCDRDRIWSRLPLRRPPPPSLLRPSPSHAFLRSCPRTTNRRRSPLPSRPCCTAPAGSRRVRWPRFEVRGPARPAPDRPGRSGSDPRTGAGAGIESRSVFFVFGSEARPDAIRRWFRRPGSAGSTFSHVSGGGRSSGSPGQAAVPSRLATRSCSRFSVRRWRVVSRPSYRFMLRPFGPAHVPVMIAHVTLSCSPFINSNHYSIPISSEWICSLFGSGLRVLDCG